MSYIKAEIFRFTKKKSFLILLGLFTVVYSGITFMFRTDAQDVAIFTALIIQMAPVLIGIATFIMIYTDDIAAHSNQISIGYGIDRWKLVLYKVIEMILVVLAVFAYALLLALVLKVVLNTGLDLNQLKDIIGINLIHIFFISSVAGLIAFISQKSTLAITTFVLLSTNLIDNLLELVLRLQFLQKLFPNGADFLPYSLLSNMHAVGIKFQNGGVLIAYGVVAIVVSMLVYNKSELDF